MPWCVRKCPYCDFNSHELKEAAPDASYVDALIRDLDTQLPQVAQRRIDTVFFGGGTPSLFEPEQFSRLLGALRQRIAVAHDVEVTLEANPGTIERGQFAGYRDAGINRVSLGAQTFSARALQVLGRIHSPQDTESAVAELRAAKLENFNLDLMYALPGQTEDEALEDVRTACALQPSHISYYQLTLEPGTVFHARPPALPDEDAAWQMQRAGQRLLAEAGYAQYEVSAYAREGLRCRHNLNYWRFGDYLGIGAGAHGKISVSLPDQILRTSKPRQPRAYQKLLGPAQPAAARAVLIGESSCIAPRDLPFEFMLNALRLNEGFTARGYRQRTGLGMDSVSAKLTEAQARGLMEEADQGWRPTQLGLRFLNDLQSSFLA